VLPFRSGTWKDVTPLLAMTIEGFLIRTKAMIPLCWKGEGYRKYLREMEEIIFETRLVFIT